MFQGYDENSIDREDVINGISITFNHSIFEKKSIVCVCCNFVTPVPGGPSAFSCLKCKENYIYDGKNIHEIKDIITRKFSPIIFYKPGIFLPAVIRTL